MRFQDINHRGSYNHKEKFCLIRITFNSIKMNNFLVLPQHILCPEFKLLPMLAPERFLQFSEKVRLKQFSPLNITLITQQTIVIRNPVIEMVPLSATLPQISFKTMH